MESRATTSAKKVDAARFVRMRSSSIAKSSVSKKATLDAIIKTKNERITTVFTTISWRIAVFSAQYSFAASSRIALKRKENPE